MQAVYRCLLRFSSVLLSRESEGGKKVRVLVKTGEVIDK